MRQVAARYAPICCTAPLQSLRNIGRSISAGFIPPVGVVRALHTWSLVRLFGSTIGSLRSPHGVVT
jgi:hypothetical protein